MTEQNVKQVLSWTVEKCLYYHKELQERYISETQRPNKERILALI